MLHAMMNRVLMTWSINRWPVMMARIKNCINGDTILYRLLLGMVLFGYIVPTYIIVTFLGTVPFYDTRVDFAPAWWLNILALLVVGLTIVPVWRWVRPRVHQIVYAQDDIGIDMIGQINASLDASHAQPSLLASVAETIARTMKLPYVAISAADGTAASFGQPIKGGTITRKELVYQETTVGCLDVMSRLADEPLTVGEYRLLSNLAHQVSITLHAAQLSAALQSSREQLVLAQEEERRRIRRDLHDSLGPTLASLRLQLSAMRHTLRSDPDAAERLIDELRDDVRAATAEIRRLVYDLRPPMLDEFGLVGALRNLELTNEGLTRSVEAPDVLPPLPAAVEVAVYRIAAEALHNVARHAHATNCTISLSVSEISLMLAVMDNGCGLPATYLAGVGHRSMHERAAELGGSVALLPAPAGGTCVTATFPLKAAHHD